MQGPQGEVRWQITVWLLCCEAAAADVPLFAAEEEETFVATASEAAAVTAAVGERIAGSINSGRIIGAVAYTDADSGLESGVKASVFGGRIGGGICFAVVLGNGR